MIPSPEKPLANSKNNNQLILIQYLRAIAALMVVIHHAREPQAWLYNPLEFYQAFAWGVDIFFVISGFIMYVAAINEKPLEFIKKRAIQVIPLYWAATLLLLLILTKFHPFSITSDEFFHLIKSLLFIPHYTPTPPIKIYPYLIPGWTLNYEMFFYLIFCLGLLWNRTMLVCSVLILSLTISGFLFSYQNAVMKVYSNPILLEFLGGLWIGYIYKSNKIPKNLWFLIVFGFLGLFSLPFLYLDDYVIGARIVFSLMIIIGAISISGQPPYSRLLNLLGDASYSIYLTHAVVSIRIAHKLWSSVPVTGMFQFIMWVMLTLLISSIIGVIVYTYFEKPVLRFLRSKI